MEIPYIFAILNTLIIGVYVYSAQVFNYSDKGLTYLQYLLDNPKELNNNPVTLSTLKNRDFINMRSFTLQRSHVNAIFAGTVIINCANYAMYPYDTLLYSWMEYILVIAAMVANFDVLTILVTMRKNNKLVSTICNAYYKATQATDTANKEFNKMVNAIEDAFEKLSEDINNATNKENNKNEDDEK